MRKGVIYIKQLEDNLRNQGFKDIMQQKLDIAVTSNENGYTPQELKNPIKVSLAFFSVTAPPPPPKTPRYVIYGKADIDLEWQGYTFRMQSFTWRVHRNNGKIVIIFPSQSYPDPENKPGRKQKKYSVPTFTVIPEKGYKDIYHDITECIQKEVRKKFGDLIEKYLKHKGVPKEAYEVNRKSWQLRDHYDVFREAERERWNTPRLEGSPDPIDVEVVELYESNKGKSTKNYAISGTAHINLKLEGYTFEIRNLFWGIKHQSYKARVKSPKLRHLSEDKSPDKRFITLGFRPFSPDGNKDLQLKIEDVLISDILELYSSEIDKRKEEFQHAYEAIRSDIKRRRLLALSMKNRSKRNSSS